MYMSISVYIHIEIDNIHVYVYVYTYKYLFIHICMYIYIYIYLYLNQCTKLGTGNRLVSRGEALGQDSKVRRRGAGGLPCSTELTRSQRGTQVHHHSPCCTGSGRDGGVRTRSVSKQVQNRKRLQMLSGQPRLNHQVTGTMH